MTSITITFQHGTGNLFANEKARVDQRQPKLEGFVELSMSKDETRDGPKFRAPIAAWAKETKAKEAKDGKPAQPAQPYYSISIGGYLNGALFPEKNKRSDDSPDYTGTIGEDRELRIVGWKRKAQDTNEMYVSLLISQPQSQGRERAPAPAADFI